MNPESRRLAGLLLVVLPTVMIGGVSILTLLIRDPAYMANPLRQNLWRAGHAHAGVFLVLSLVALRYVDEAELGARLRWFVRLSIPSAAILVPAAFFLSVIPPDATEPNGLIALAYAGAMVLASGVIVLGVGLLRKPARSRQLTLENGASTDCCSATDEFWCEQESVSSKRPGGGVMSHTNSAELRLPVDGVAEGAHSSRTRIYVGRILSGFAIVFLLFDAALKVLKVPAAVEGTVQLGYQESTIFPIGLIQIVCLVVYVIPRTSVIGAILWTGYLGGAIATHVRVGSPLFSHTLFPIYVAALLWGGLWLRDRRIRALISPSRSLPPVQSRRSSS